MTYKNIYTTFDFNLTIWLFETFRSSREKKYVRWLFVNCKNAPFQKIVEYRKLRWKINFWWSIASPEMEIYFLNSMHFKEFAWNLLQSFSYLILIYSLNFPKFAIARFFFMKSRCHRAIFIIVWGFLSFVIKIVKSMTKRNLVRAMKISHNDCPGFFDIIY